MIRSTRARLRRDAEVNREKVLTVAAEVLAERGHGVPMADIAGAAGVGVGTLYRHFANRAELLAALQMRAYELLLDALQRITATEVRGAAAIEDYLLECLRLAHRLVLPLRGATPLTDPEAIDARAQIYRGIEALVDRGHADSSILGDINALDVIACGAMISAPIPNTSQGKVLALRHIKLFIRGIRAPAEHPLPAPRGTMGRNESLWSGRKN